MAVRQGLLTAGNIKDHFTVKCRFHTNHASFTDRTEKSLNRFIILQKNNTDV